MGADLAYLGTRFIATKEAHAVDTQAVHHQFDRVEIVYTNLFTGVHGNYLRSIVRGARSRRPAGSRQEQDELRLRQGQGVARHLGRGPGRRPMDDVPSVAELVERLKNEYNEAKTRLGIAR